MPLDGLPLLLSMLAASAGGLAMVRHATTRGSKAQLQVARGRLLEELSRDPGLRVHELCDRLALNRGTARYHLYILERAGVIARLSGGGAQHFFGPGPDAEEMARLMVLRRERAPDIVQAVLDHPGIVQQDLLSKIGMHRKVFRSYGKDLVRAGLIEENRSGRTRTYRATQELVAILDRWAPLAAKHRPRFRAEP